jgi:hypothetical protein
MTLPPKRFSEGLHARELPRPASRANDPDGSTVAVIAETEAVRQHESRAAVSADSSCSSGRMIGGFAVDEPETYGGMRRKDHVPDWHQEKSKNDAAAASCC